MVIVSRYAGSAKSYDDDFFTGFGNKLFTKIINILFKANYTDSLVMFRAFRQKAALKMRIHKQDEENKLRRLFFYLGLKRKFYLLNSWEIGSSIRAAKLGLRCNEIPGDEPKRIGGDRKMSIIFNGIGGLIQIFYEFFMSFRSVLIGSIVTSFAIVP